MGEREVSASIFVRIGGLPRLRLQSLLGLALALALLLGVGRLCRIHYWLGGPWRAGWGNRDQASSRLLPGHTRSVGLRAFQDPANKSEPLKYLLAPPWAEQTVKWKLINVKRL